VHCFLHCGRKLSTSSLYNCQQFLSYSSAASFLAFLASARSVPHHTRYMPPRASSRWPQGRHYPILAGMARMETPVVFAHLISFFGHFLPFFLLCHRILPIVSPVFEISKIPGMAIAIPAILVSPPLVGHGTSDFLQVQRGTGLTESVLRKLPPDLEHVL